MRAICKFPPKGFDVIVHTSYMLLNSNEGRTTHNLICDLNVCASII